MANTDDGSTAPGRAAPGRRIAGWAVRKGVNIARGAVDRRISFGGLTSTEIQRAITGRGIVGSTAAVIVTRLATRSVPGALMVGGGLLAKALFDRRQLRRAQERSAAKAAEKTRK